MERPRGDSPNSFDEEVQEYFKKKWEGHHPSDGCAPTDFPKARRIMTLTAFDAIDSFLNSTGEKSVISKFSEGRLFSANHFPHRTIVKVDTEEFLTGGHQVYGGIVYEAKDNKKILVGFPSIQEELPADHFPKGLVINPFSKPEVMPGRFTIGEVWHDEWKTRKGERRADMYKPTSVKVFRLGSGKKLRIPAIVRASLHTRLNPHSA